MIEIGLGSVQSWECDTMGHMNVQFYVARMSDSLPSLLLALGLGPRQCRALDVTLAPRDHHIRFLKELRPGEPFTVLGGVLAAKSDGLRLYQEMRNTATGAVAASVVTEAVLVDAERRGDRLPLPADALARAAELVETLPAHAEPRGLALDPPRPRPRWDEADRLGLMLTQQGAVSPAECDERGLMLARAVIGRVADSVPNMVAKTRGVDRSAGETGGAALEYRLVYHATPRRGDLLALRAGIRAVGAKALTWGHWLFDRETGEAVATTEAVVVSFDLKTRKSVEMPAAQRHHLGRFLVPGLTV
jgi:acyl-CoA thioester hydrolase